MRPLIIDLGREYRGGQHQAFLLLEGLRKRGHAPELLAIRDSELASRAEEIGAPVHPVAAGWRRLAAVSQIRKLVRERRIDVVHANEPHALTSAWLARAHRSVPLVAARRIALPLSGGHLSLARYRAAARVVAVSHYVEKSVFQSGLAPDCVSVIYDGVQIPAELSEAQRQSARAQLGIVRGIPCIGNVAAFVPEKGHALLLNAFAKVRGQLPDCVLLLRGEGPDMPTLQSLAQKLQLEGAVKFLSPSVDIETMFAAMDIFTFPSHEEPLGSALLAAMAHGLPIAAIARGGIPEVVEDGKNGLLMKDLDPDEFSDAITRLVIDPEKAIRLGNAARETIVKRFSGSQMVEETLRVYELLATGV